MSDENISPLNKMHENIINIEGYTAVVPNEVYARKLPASGGVTADPTTWEQQAADATGFLLVSISSVPSAKEVLEKLAEEAGGIIADVLSGNLPQEKAFYEDYNEAKIDMHSKYTLVQQKLLGMPYSIIQSILLAAAAPRAHRDLIYIANSCHPLRDIAGEEDADLIEITYTRWLDSALERIPGDKSSPEYYRRLINPKTNFVKRMFPAVNGKLPPKEAVKQALAGGIRGDAHDAILSALDAVYSCNLDDIRDRTPERWEEVLFVTANNLHRNLRSGAFEKLRAAERRQAFKPESMSWLEQEARKRKKQQPETVKLKPVNEIDILERDISSDAKKLVMEYRLDDTKEALQCYRRGLAEYDARIAELEQQIQQSSTNVSQNIYREMREDFTRSRDVIAGLIPKAEAKLNEQAEKIERFSEAIKLMKSAIRAERKAAKEGTKYTKKLKQTGNSYSL